MSEKAITAKIRKWLHQRGCYTLKIHGSAYMPAGFPDLLVINKGRVYCIEVKVPGKNATPLQEERMRQLREHGCPCTVARSVEDVEVFYDRFILIG